MGRARSHTRLLPATHRRARGAGGLVGTTQRIVVLARRAGVLRRVLCRRVAVVAPGAQLPVVDGKHVGGGGGAPLARGAGEAGRLLEAAARHVAKETSGAGAASKRRQVGIVVPACRRQRGGGIGGRRATGAPIPRVARQAAGADQAARTVRAVGAHRGHGALGGTERSCRAGGAAGGVQRAVRAAGALQRRGRRGGAVKTGRARVALCRLRQRPRVAGASRRGGRPVRKARRPRGAGCARLLPSARKEARLAWHRRTRGIIALVPGGAVGACRRATQRVLARGALCDGRC